MAGAWARYAAAFAAGVLATGAGVFAAHAEIVALYSHLFVHERDPGQRPDGPAAAIGTAEWLPEVYKSEAGELGRLQFHKHVGAPEDYPPWRAAYVEELSLDRFGAERVYAGRPPQEPSLVHSEGREGHTLEKYTMPAVDGDLIIFYRLVPDAPRGCNVVIAPGSGHGGPGTSWA